MSALGCGLARGCPALHRVRPGSLSQLPFSEPRFSNPHNGNHMQPPLCYKASKRRRSRGLELRLRGSGLALGLGPGPRPLLPPPSLPPPRAQRPSPVMLEQDPRTQAAVPRASRARVSPLHLAPALPHRSTRRPCERRKMPGAQAAAVGGEVWGACWRQCQSASRGPARRGSRGTHSETCTKMSSDPFSGVMKPWPCERENCLQTPLNTGPAEARAVLKIREGAWSRGLGTPLPPPPGPCLRSLPPGYGKCSLGQRPPIVRLVQSSHHPFGQ